MGSRRSMIKKKGLQIARIDKQSNSRIRKIKLNSRKVKRLLQRLKLKRLKLYLKSLKRSHLPIKKKVKMLSKLLNNKSLTWISGILPTKFRLNVFLYKNKFKIRGTAYRHLQGSQSHNRRRSLSRKLKKRSIKCQ